MNSSDRASLRQELDAVDKENNSNKIDAQKILTNYPSNVKRQPNKDSGRKANTKEPEKLNEAKCTDAGENISRTPALAKNEELNDLARLVDQAIGSRSKTDFAEEAGLSISFVSRLVNRTLPGIPSTRSLMKISSAHPQNGITQQMLFEAAGYSTEKTAIAPCPDAKVPAFAQSPGFSLGLLLNYLTMQFPEFRALHINLMREFFEIRSDDAENIIVGIPMILAPGDGIEKVRRALTLFYMNAPLYYMSEIDKCRFVVVTNRKDVFDLCSKDTSGTVAVLTNDYQTIAERSGEIVM